MTPRSGTLSELYCESEELRLCRTAVDTWLPSSMRSKMAVTLTVCGTFQFCGRKTSTRDAGCEMFTTLLSKSSTIVTFEAASLGCEVSTTSYQRVSKVSVRRMPVVLMDTPATSLSLMATTVDSCATPTYEGSSEDATNTRSR